MIALEIVFWTAVGLLVYTHAGYPLALAALVRLRPRRPAPGREAGEPGGDLAAPGREAGEPGGDLAAPGREAEEAASVSLIIAAHDEADVIERKIADVLALDYPRRHLQLIVASDGSEDATAELARRAGADLVLELPRRGKLAAQNAAVEAATGELLAFSDANSLWRPDALRELVAPLADPAVGYVCGQVRFADPGGGNQEGLYWRYEMVVRRLESDLGGITAGNGAIYAVRRDAYLFLEPSRSHDLNFPFQLAKRGRRAVYAPRAVAEERMVPTVEGEFARKRRMMTGLWDIVIRDGMLNPRGYRPAYAFEVASHRLLRYLSPALHVIALGANVALVGEGTIYAVTLGAQGGLLLAAALAGVLPLAPLRIARYYVAVTASIAAGLWDRLRRGAPGAWERAEGTR